VRISGFFFACELRAKLQVCRKIAAHV